MTNRKNIIIFTAIAVVVIGFSTWFIYRDIINRPLTSEKNKNIETSASNLTTSDVVNIANIEEIKKQIPNLDRAIVFKGDFTEEQKNRAITEIKMITASLKADYDKLDEWLTLGIWRKTVGDYEGAVEAWEFATIIRPKGSVAFHNLGDLYSQYIVDFPKAEKYYLTAIEKDPQTVFYYVKLYEFYRYFVKKPDLAEDIIIKAIKATGDQNMEKLLADYRKEIGK